MKRRVLKAFVSTMVAASLLSQTAMAAVVSEEIPGSVSGETSSREYFWIRRNADRTDTGTAGRS